MDIERDSRIIALYNSGVASMSELAQEFSVSRSLVGHIVKPKPRDNMRELARREAFERLDEINALALRVQEKWGVHKIAARANTNALMVEKYLSRTE